MSNNCNSCNVRKPKCPCPCPDTCECPKPQPVDPCQRGCQIVPLPVLGPAFYTGEGAPSDTLGRNLDYYLDRTVCILYQRVNGEWISLGPLCGQEDVCAAFVQETPPTVEEGAILGSLWVNPSTGYLSYFDGTDWVPIADVAAFARTNIETEIAPNQILSTLVNPSIPQDGANTVYDLADVMMNYQYAINVTPTSDPVSISIADHFLPTIFPGVSVQGLPADPTAFASLDVAIEFDQLPRILITFDEVRDGITTLSRQIAQDVAMPLLYNGVINLAVPFTFEVGSIVFGLDFTGATVTTDGPIVAAIADGTLTVSLDIETLSLAGNVALQKIIERSLSNEVQISNVTIQWGFPDATLRIGTANYTFAVDVSGVEIFTTAPVFVAQPAGLKVPLDVEWTIETPTVGTSFIDNSALSAGVGALPDIVLTDTTEGYGIYFDLLYLNVDTSETVRSGSLPRHNLLTRGGERSRVITKKQPQRKNKRIVSKKNVTSRMRNLRLK